MAETAPSPADKAAARRLRSTLREIREELVRIDAALARYAAAGEVERTALWDDLTPMVAREAKEIDRRLVKIAELVAQNDRVAGSYSDKVTRIDNLWGDVKRAWKTAPASLGAVRGDIDRCILEIGYLTVPERANENLQSVRVGATLNFHDEFAHEITSKDARTLILRWMTSHPRSVMGVVDVASGVIIRASGHRIRRLLSWVLVLAVVALALVSAVYAVDLVKLFEAKNPKGATSTTYLIGILAAYAGAVLHVLIAALKQQRRANAEPDQRFTAIGNFTVWVHINEMYLMLYAFAIPAMAYGVILATGKIDNLYLVFVGFSIDSLLGVALERFDKFVAARTEAIAGSIT
ncbi:MAG: hypothetical protein ACRDT4_08905 [Micromonosporaceae bacterium]